MKKIILFAAMAMISSAAFAQKFAHINSQEVFQLMPEMDDVRAQMEKISKENQDVLTTMYDEYKAKGQAYQQNANNWTASIRETKEKELMDLENRIQEAQQSIQQEMQVIQQKATAPVMQKFNDTIKDIAKKGGYIYVFDSQSLLYIDDTQSVDITNEARKALNIPEGRTLEDLQKEMQAKAQQQQQ